MTAQVAAEPAGGHQRSLLGGPRGVHGAGESNRLAAECQFPCRRPPPSLYGCHTKAVSFDLSMRGSMHEGWGWRNRVWLALVVAALSFLGAPVVRADAARARAHYDKGRSYFQVGEYRKALDA